MPVIGIDLGTANSCVAFCRKGSIKVIENEQHERSVPSCVAFTPVERFIGFLAESKKKSNPKNTVYGIKRIIGRSHDYADSLRIKEAWPFELVDSEGRPKIRIQYRGEWKSLYPEEISAMVLSHMKNIAATKTGAVSGAVITVPASFDCAQRKATCDAAEIAGIKVLGLVNETTAVALAYRLRNLKKFSARNVLVLHLGVGTFDVSVITIDDLKLTVKSTIGNSQLGGENFTGQLFSHFTQPDITNHPASAANMHIACEKLKVSLSDEATASTVAIIQGQHKECVISREDFNKKTSYYIDAITATISQAIYEARIEVDQIDDVLVTGGNAGMPMISEMLTRFGFDSKIRSVDIVEDAARGAAALAALFSNEEDFRWKGLVLQEQFCHSMFSGKVEVFRRGAIPWDRNMFASCRNGRIDYELQNIERVIDVRENRSDQKYYQRDICRISFTSSLDQDVSFDLSLDQSGLLKARSHKREINMDIDMGLAIQQMEKSAENCKKFNDDEKKREIVTEALDKLEHQALKMQKSMKDLAAKCEIIAEWASRTTDPSKEDVLHQAWQLRNISSEVVHDKRHAETQTPISNMIREDGRQTNELKLETPQEEAENHLRKKQAEINESNQKFRAIQKARDQLNKKQKESEREFQKLKEHYEQLHQNLQQKYHTLEVQNETLEKDNEQQQKTIHILEDEKKSIKERRQSQKAKKQPKEKMAKLQTHKNQEDEYLEALTTLRKQNETFQQKARDQLNKKQKESEREFQELKEHHEQLHQNIQQKYHTLEVQNETLEKDNEQQQKTINILEDEKKSLKERRQSQKAKKQPKEEMAKLQTHKNQEDEHLEALTTLRKQNETLQQDIDDHLATIKSLESKPESGKRKRRQPSTSKTSLLDRYRTLPAPNDSCMTSKSKSGKLTIDWDAPKDASVYVIIISRRKDAMKGGRLSRKTEKCQVVLNGVPPLMIYESFVCAEQDGFRMENLTCEVKPSSLRSFSRLLGRKSSSKKEAKK